MFYDLFQLTWTKDPQIYYRGDDSFFLFLFYLAYKNNSLVDILVACLDKITEYSSKHEKVI